MALVPDVNKSKRKTMNKKYQKDRKVEHRDKNQKNDKKKREKSN